MAFVVVWLVGVCGCAVSVLHGGGVEVGEGEGGDGGGGWWWLTSIVYKHYAANKQQDFCFLSNGVHYIYNVDAD
jgi:hypothetical protein